MSNLPKNFFNMPILMPLPEDAIGSRAFLDDKGNTRFAHNQLFDLTLPSFLPTIPPLLTEEREKMIEFVRGWRPDQARDRYYYRKEILEKILKKQISVDQVLGRGEFAGMEPEIKHTHPTFQPWDHQALDAYALKYSTNMLLTHEVRVGKTITATLGAYNNPLVKKVLIICPKIVVHDAWVKTFTQWTDWEVAVYGSVTGKKRTAKRDEDLQKWINGEIPVLVVNIDYFTLKYDEIFSTIPVDQREDLMIIDEAHFLSRRQQNISQYLQSNRSKNILKYRVDSKGMLWLLTGTPARNYEYEIFSLFYLLSPIKAHSRRLDWYETFFNNFARVVQTPSQQNGFTFEVANGVKYKTALEELNSVHRLHRNQADLWGDPDKYNVYEDVYIYPNRSQEENYKSIKKNTAGLFFDFDNPLVRDIFLRQIAVDPRILRKNVDKGVDDLVNHEDRIYVDALCNEFIGKPFSLDITEELKEVLYEQYSLNERGAKAEWALEWIEANLERIQGNKRSDSFNTNGLELDSPEYRTAQLNGRQPVIFFSFFTSFLDIFYVDLKEKFGEDLTVAVIDGTVTGVNRQIIIDKFQAGEIDILLANTVATKEGVTLNRADEAIFFDRVWENTTMEQVKARIHNPSKPHPKIERFLMLEDSIDESIAEANATKAENVQYVNKDVINDVQGVKKDAVNNLFTKLLGGR